MLFGGAVAAVAAPAITPTLSKTFPAGSTITVDLKRPEFISRPYVYMKEFDLDTDVRSLVMNVAPNFAMESLSLQFYPEVKYKSLADFFDNAWVDLSLGEDLLIESRAYLLAYSLCFGSVPRYSPFHLIQPMIVNDQLSVNFDTRTEDWKPLPGVKGQLIVQGLQRYNLNHI